MRLREQRDVERRAHAAEMEETVHRMAVLYQLQQPQKYLKKAGQRTESLKTKNEDLEAAVSLMGNANSRWDDVYHMNVRKNLLTDICFRQIFFLRFAPSLRARAQSALSSPVQVGAASASSLKAKNNRGRAPTLAAQRPHLYSGRLSVPHAGGRSTRRAFTPSGRTPSGRRSSPALSKSPSNELAHDQEINRLFRSTATVDIPPPEQDHFGGSSSFETAGAAGPNSAGAGGGPNSAGSSGNLVLVPMEKHDHVGERAMIRQREQELSRRKEEMRNLEVAREEEHQMHKIWKEKATETILDLQQAVENMTDKYKEELLEKKELKNRLEKVGNKAVKVGPRSPNSLPTVWSGPARPGPFITRFWRCDDPVVIW